MFDDYTLQLNNPAYQHLGSKKNVLIFSKFCGKVKHIYIFISYEKITLFYTEILTQKIEVCFHS